MYKRQVYKREPLGYAVYVLTVIYLLFTVYLRYRYKKRYGKIRFFPIWMFIIPLAIGTMVQACVYGVSLAWTSVALGLVGIHMGLQNEHSYIDPLTRLYNRNYLDYMLAVISGKSTCTAGLMIDLDYFKSINDKYGHSVGDEALIDAALIIQSSVPAKADAIRFAGDEFIVIMQNSSEAEINEVCDALRSGWITTGPKTKLLEKKVAEWLGTPKAVCLNSQTACAETALRILGIGEGDEVIVPAYTYTASASVVCHVGELSLIHI